MKNILLIGGSYGIGKAIARQLADTHHVMIAARTAEEIPDNCSYFQFDVLKDDIGSLDLPATIDGLVYCPGSINLKPFKMLTSEAFLKDLEINFLAMVKIVHQLLPKLKESEHPSLVLFSTVAVKLGMPFHTSVAASKGAVEGFARALAAEYAPSMRVNVIAPSLTDTPLAGKLLSSEDKKDKMADLHPLDRIGTVDDIAAMACFLLSDRASWMTGQVLGVDGGLSAINKN